MNVKKISECLKEFSNAPYTPTKNLNPTNDETESDSPIIEFYKKPATYQIDIHHTKKADPSDTRNTLKCSYCGRRFLKIQSVNASKCHNCGKIFCPEHHLPEHHKCKRSNWGFLSRLLNIKTICSAKGFKYSVDSCRFKVKSMFDWLKKRIWMEMSHDDVPHWVMEAWVKTCAMPNYNYYFKRKNLHLSLQYGGNRTRSNGNQVL